MEGIMGEEESDAMPWGRGGSFSWGAARAESRRDRTADLVDESWLDEASRKTLEEAIALFNHSAKAAHSQRSMVPVRQHR